jgi:hypothetical protein
MFDYDTYCLALGYCSRAQSWSIFSSGDCESCCVSFPPRVSSKLPSSISAHSLIVYYCCFFASSTLWRAYSPKLKLHRYWSATGVCTIYDASPSCLAPATFYFRVLFVSMSTLSLAFHYHQVWSSSTPWYLTCHPGNFNLRHISSPTSSRLTLVSTVK